MRGVAPRGDGAARVRGWGTRATRATRPLAGRTPLAPSAPPARRTAKPTGGSQVSRVSQRQILPHSFCCSFKLVRRHQERSRKCLGLSFFLYFQFFTMSMLYVHPAFEAAVHFYVCVLHVTYVHTCMTKSHGAICQFYPEI